MIIPKEEKDLKRKEFEHLKRIGVFKLEGKCSICGSAENTCFHHIVPLSTSNGTNAASNIIEVCYECHSDIHGALKFITSSCGEVQKEAVKKSNTKEIKIKYNFTLIDKGIYGVKTCKGNNELIDCINEVIERVNSKGGAIRWSKTNMSTYAPYGARKTIHSQATYYNEEYKLCRRDYDCGYIEIYVPNKRGLKKVV